MMKSKQRFRPCGYGVLPARSSIYGKEYDLAYPCDLGGLHAQCPMCRADWEDCPIGKEEISSKQLARRSGISQRRIDYLISVHRIAARTCRPRLIPILRCNFNDDDEGEMGGLPDEYVWCPLCAAVWATGSNWEWNGYTPKELSDFYGVSIQTIYQAIHKGDLRVLWLRNGAWWAPHWEVFDFARRRGWSAPPRPHLIF